MPRSRLVVLVSGRGSNLENLIRASRDGRMDADIVLVISNRANARAVEIARSAGIEVKVIESQGRNREVHEELVMDAIDLAHPDLVLLAGYLRILTPQFIRRYHGRLINIHPSLLPAFPGLDAQDQAHQGGVRIAGCTTHFVNEEVDAGAILMQAAVALPPDATPEQVRLRILEAEHRIFPMTVQLLVTGRARLEGDRVVFRDVPAPSSDILVSPGEPK